MDFGFEKDPEPIRLAPPRRTRGPFFWILSTLAAIYAVVLVAALLK